jgi:hypothetical protein
MRDNEGTLGWSFDMTRADYKLGIGLHACERIATGKRAAIEKDSGRE